MDEIDTLPPLRDVIRDNNLRAEKSLGQNFLLDQNITDKIAGFARPRFDGSETVFEIGPGPGGLTRSLLRAGASKVIAIEYDERAVKALEPLSIVAGGRLDIVHGDALTVDLGTFAPAPRFIVANLPYNIATPLLLGWLRQIRQDPDAYRGLYLMFQSEVAERIIAPCGSKSYGRLSVMAQWLCRCRHVYTLPPSAFTPPPKVTSAVVELTPEVQQNAMPDFAVMESIVKAAFAQRRKMIRSTLKPYTDYFEKCGLDPMARAENLTVADYNALALAVQQNSVS